MAVCLRIQRPRCLHRGQFTNTLSNAEDLVLADDEVFLAVQLDLGTRIFADEHEIADVHVEGNGLAIISDPPSTHGDDLRLLRFFLRGVRDDDSTHPLLLLFYALHKNSIAQGTNIHGSPPLIE